ncbi:macrophage mannose receptor 1-like isoform X2 [Homarus americanus]|uniref:macrophage mannose receptor 1-like isoform X2 n=1 Tax=Homarus americanus TaxID=6706 RepID=UPI001C48F1A6|nr:macrophage mannose receptor 1-like isoform X2 [Homarus americanus]
MTLPRLLSVLVIVIGPNYVGPQPPPPPPVKCPDGWSYWNNHCYYLSTQYTDWDSAQGWCKENFGSQLVSITNKDENIFISGMLSSQNIWIGLHDDNNGHNWHWADGTQLSYSNWLNGEPNNANGNEHCGELRTEDMWYGHWNDISCSSQDPFVCKMTVKTCPESFTYHEGKCYYASNFDATWDAARYKCKQFNSEAELVSIHSDDENSFFHGKLTHSSPGTWLGLTYNSSSQVWSWSDGADGNYTNWNDGEPNDMESEWCAEIIDYSGKWNNLPCTQSRSFGCEFLPTHTVGCEDGWEAFDKYCYKHSNADHSYEMDTYDNTRAKCQGLGGDLVSIHTPEENDFVFSLLSIERFYTSTWIGMTDNGHPGDLTWSDGTSVTFTNWGVVYSYPFTHIPTCAQYAYTETQALWSMNKCEEVSYYICKKPQEARPINPPQDNCTECLSRRKRYFYKLRKPWINQDQFASHNKDESRFSSPFYSHFSSFDDKHHPLFRNSGFLSHRFRKPPFIPVRPAGDKTTRYFSLTRSPSPVTPSPFLAATQQAKNKATDTMTGDTDTVSNGSLGSTPIHTNRGNITNIAIDTVTLSVPRDMNCELGDEAYKGSCYNFPGFPLSWNEAEANCEAQNSHLLVLNDRFESAYISAFLGNMGTRIWIGLSGTIDAGGSVTFSWVNHDAIDFTNWNEFEPDPTHGTCVAASGMITNPGLWTVRDCDDHFQFICEYDREGYTTPTMPSTKPPIVYCAEGWTHQGGRCYQVFQEPLSWGGGEQFCASFGAHLASVGSAVEQELIKELPGMHYVSDYYNSVWVGLKLGSESGYEWTDGTPFDYVDWAEGQPDSQYYRENCASANMDTFKLSDCVCDAHLPYVCEAEEGSMITTIAPPTVTPDVMCDDSTWYLYDNHCYKFISASDEEPQTWWESHRRCRDEGADLASIHSFEENYWIESKIFELSDNILWVGGRANVDSGYDWVDGSPFDFDNWAKGEPNNFMDQEDCIALYTHQQGYWNDQNCANKEGRVCKRLHGKTLPPVHTTKVPDGHCPQGWFHTGIKCLQLFTEKKNFSHARASCKQLGTDVDLASIHSPAEQAYLTAILGTMEVNVWLGLRYSQTFQWVDQSTLTYTNWASGEPNGALHGEDCVHAYFPNGEWNDIDCSNEYGYICMMLQDSDIVTQSPPPACEPPYDHYIRYNSACYRPDSNSKTWQEAETLCAGEGAHLVSALDMGESAMLWVLLQESGFTDAWIGLNNLQDVHIFKWSDDWPTTYTNWDIGQPNVSFSNHNCTRVSSTNGNWFTASCNESSPFICKFKNGTVPTPDPPITGKCPDSRWLDLGGSYCYLISDQKKPWNDASMNCVQESANLVSIHSEAEMELINMAINSIRDTLWIGLVQKKSGYGWSDHSAFNFVNWCDGEPNSNDEDCTEMYANSGQWNDADCSNARNFMCKTLKIHQSASTNPPPITMPATTHHPSGWKSSSLSAGGIIGIIIATLLVTSVIGYVGYSHVQKKPEPMRNGGTYSFDNALYSAKDDNSKVEVKRAQDTSLDFEADCGDTDA